jgi:hemopexin
MEADGGFFENGFDTVVNWGNGKAYFFLQHKYLRYDIGGDRADPGYPLPISGNWQGLEEAGFAGRVDAIINWGNGKAYVFSLDKYLRFDLLTDTTDPGYPKPIAGNWPGLAEAGFAQRVGAGVNWGNGKVYMFNLFMPDQYVRYDIGADRVDPGYPRPIAGNWPGVLEAGFTSGHGVYACVKWGQNREFLFQRNKYLPFDVGVDNVDAGYPLAIGGNWPGFAEAGFGESIDTAIRWWNGKAFFFLGNQYIRYDIATDKVDAGYPLPIAGNWPGMAEAGFGEGIQAAVEL